MKTLIATLGVGKGTWGKVKRICSEEWDSVILLGNAWAKDTYKPANEWIVLEDEKDVCQLVEDIKPSLDRDLGEIYINLLSGSGREHNAVVAALLSLNKKFTMVCVCDDGVQYFGE
ncbi:MAG: hypothetical protein KO463_05675 [Candidatus Methanofastidiosa archaeon]|nr:hypothetical protein [Candidatus Methanofastidiosa archaeon]